MFKNGMRGLHTEITISWKTIFKIFLACLIAYVVVRLWRFEELLLVSLLIAIAFRPLVQWTRKRAWPRWTGVLLSASIMLGCTALLFGILVPVISDQGGALVKKLPDLKQHLSERLPSSGPLRNMGDEFLSAPAFSNPEPLLKGLLAWGSVAVQRVAELFVVLILAIYLVADGESAFEWLTAFLPENQRQKVRAAADEATSVVSRYVTGNLLTSLLAAIYAFVVLQVLRVPNAVLLAVLAGIFDLLPIIGFFLFIIPAILLALTVSPKAALLVGLLYGAYHLAENYFIVPKVYGNRLRLSTLVVLVSCLAAGLLAGVLGVIIVLPVVACYPIVERMWLRPYLEPDTVPKHKAIDAS